MTFDQFINKWNGKLLDYDGYYGGQCVDLYRQYCKEVLNVPQSPAVGGAKDIWNTYLAQYFDRIPNSPNGIPKRGDIMIWGIGYGPYGHVGVVTSASLYSFYSFDQNDPLGTKCHYQWHNYRGVLGWLRLRSQSLTPQQKEQKIRDIFGQNITSEERLRQTDIVIHG